MKLTIKESIRMFARQPWDIVKLEAEEAWNNGLNSDSNPYSKGTNKHSWWYTGWLQRNLKEHIIWPTNKK